MCLKLQVIRVLSDGRPGHENQTVGLAQALSRRTGARLDTVRITGGGYARRFQRAADVPNPENAPQLLIGAGHATHLPLLVAAWRLGAKCVTVMKPTWPMRWFDLCLVPAHDIKSSNSRPSIILTRGALNRIPEVIPPKERRGLVLVGGPSKHYGWSEEELRNAIIAVMGARPELTWTVGDSRRTPLGFLSRLKAGAAVQLAPCEQTTREWVPAQLLAAEEAWVTEDSISMLHEAVTAGARTGVLPTPVCSPRARVLNAVRGLVADGYATTYTDWRRNGRQLSNPRRLHETARCADLILQRFFTAR